MRFLAVSCLVALFVLPVAAGDGAYVRGTVTDADGKPIRNAWVYVAVKSWPGGQFRITPHGTQTGKDGKSELKVFDTAEGNYYVNVAVAAFGKAFQSRYVKSPGVLE